MSVDIRPTAVHDDTHASAKARSVPVARVIAGSLAAGAVTALLLTLVVFAGATEAVITGSMLLAFGLGWAMMAVLSDRMTTQPQRWAAGSRSRHERHRPRPPDHLPRECHPHVRSTGSGPR